MLTTAHGKVETPVFMPVGTAGAVKGITPQQLKQTGADIILVTVKSGATATMADLIAEHAPSGSTVVSLQNGVGNVDLLLGRLGAMGRIVAGMVPFNVMQTHGGGEPARFHRATSGTVLIGAGVPGLREALDVKGLAVAEHPDMSGVLWGKLMLNLNNALNALSGLSLALLPFALKLFTKFVLVDSGHGLRLRASKIRPPRENPLETTG